MSKWFEKQETPKDGPQPIATRGSVYYLYPDRSYLDFENYGYEGTSTSLSQPLVTFYAVNEKYWYSFNRWDIKPGKPIINTITKFSPQTVTQVASLWLKKKEYDLMPQTIERVGLSLEIWGTISGFWNGIEAEDSEYRKQLANPLAEAFTLGQMMLLKYGTSAVEQGHQFDFIYKKGNGSYGLKYTPLNIEVSDCITSAFVPLELLKGQGRYHFHEVQRYPSQAPVFLSGNLLHKPIDGKD